MRKPGRVLIIGLALAVVFATATATAAHAATGTNVYDASATLTGPITVGHLIEPGSGVTVNLAAHGYVEREFFASGTAHAFTATSSPADGRWSIQPSAAASYKTRIIVRRPTTASRFNGTVVVEWMNVSGGESAPDWDYLNPMLVRAGYAYVGVSAQALGVEGGQAILGVGGPSGGLVHEEPARYGTLHHPGDQYALDMFAQIGRALRRRATRQSWAPFIRITWWPSESPSPPSSSPASPMPSSRTPTRSTASSSTAVGAVEKGSVGARV